MVKLADVDKANRLAERRKDLKSALGVVSSVTGFVLALDTKRMERAFVPRERRPYVIGAPSDLGSYETLERTVTVRVSISAKRVREALKAELADAEAELRLLGVDLPEAAPDA